MTSTRSTDASKNTGARGGAELRVVLSIAAIQYYNTILCYIPVAPRRPPPDDMSPFKRACTNGSSSGIASGPSSPRRYCSTSFASDGFTSGAYVPIAETCSRRRAASSSPVTNAAPKEPSSAASANTARVSTASAIPRAFHTTWLSRGRNVGGLAAPATRAHASHSACLPGLASSAVCASVTCERPATRFCCTSLPRTYARRAAR
jgi:hypothetical protein